ncbi:MAG: CpsD/CapB family tyrosine-protein kinase [Gemmataceae bacterium]|nr:CpsD/CapB family tyrosine-protein kinase [Gemmataceae bacterium]
MGRMLEALKPAKAGTARVTELEVPAPEPDAVVATETAEEVPYIEVGGPRTTVDASRAVLACPGPVAVAARRVPAEVKPPPVAVSTDSWTVQFQPWSREAGPAAAPMRRIAPEVIAYHQPDHPVARQYRSLLTGLMGQLPSGWGQVLLFTSPAPWGGTTSVLLNLAITAARQEPRRVAVVDANLRRPALAERLGLGPAHGLCDVLAGSATLANTLQETAQKNLWALPAGRSAGSAVRLPLDWLLPTLRQLRQQFDLVFVDAAAWNEGSEVSALAATCDAVYMVMNHGKETPAPNDPLSLLRQPPTNLQGCILTMR